MPSVIKAFACLCLLVLAGCAHRPTADSPTGQCQLALHQLQTAIQQADVGDAQFHPVKGFPTYRSNRFWSSFAEQPLTEPQQQEWRRQLHRLGMESLALEWQNLPAAARQDWQQQSGLNGLAGFAAECDTLLFEATRQQPLQPADLDIPDAYSTWQRVLGLYALTRYAARGAVADYQADMRTLMQQGANALTAPTHLYSPQTAAPDSAPAPLPSTSPLGIPEFDDKTLPNLLAWHTPRWQIEQQSSADQPGTATWQNGQRRIDVANPVTYTWTSLMRHDHQVLLQLNYLIWFSERPPEEPGDWYAGPLDGLIWRVTLNPDGSVLFYDSIHPCGCYHSIHLPAGSPLLIPQTGDEPLMVIHTDLPAQTPNPVLLIQAGAHYLVKVQASPASAPKQTPYALADYDTLRSLPAEQGQRSWFDPDGLIDASARPERYYLWPLGVPNAGAMRQQGHHAIAFLGRRHFDEASVEKLLGLPLPQK